MEYMVHENDIYLKAKKKKDYYFICYSDFNTEHTQTLNSKERSDNNMRVMLQE